MKRLKTQLEFQDGIDFDIAKKIIKEKFPRRPLDYWSRLNGEYVIRLNLDVIEMVDLIDLIREKINNIVKYGRC